MADLSNLKQPPVFEKGAISLSARVILKNLYSLQDAVAFHMKTCKGGQCMQCEQLQNIDQAIEFCRYIQASTNDAHMVSKKYWGEEPYDRQTNG